MPISRRKWPNPSKGTLWPPRFVLWGLLEWSTNCFVAKKLVADVFFHSMCRTYHLFVQQLRMSLFCVQQSITRPLLFWTGSIRRFDLHKVWWVVKIEVWCLEENVSLLALSMISCVCSFECQMKLVLTVESATLLVFLTCTWSNPFHSSTWGILGCPSLPPKKTPAGMTTAPSLKVWAWHPWHPTARFTLKAWDTRRRVQQASDLLWGSASRVPRRKMAEKITLRELQEVVGCGRRW